MASIRGTVYKLVSDKTDKIYIGHTTKSITLRLHKHHINYKSYKRGNYHYISAFDILEVDNNPSIIVLETVDCTSLKQLKNRERHHIEQNANHCVNINVPSRAPVELLNDKYMKYRDASLESKSQLILCSCGRMYTRGHMSRHIKSNMHNNNNGAIKVT